MSRPPLSQWSDMTSSDRENDLFYNATDEEMWIAITSLMGDLLVGGALADLSPERRARRGARCRFGRARRFKQSRSAPPPSGAPPPKLEIASLSRAELEEGIRRELFTLAIRHQRSLALRSEIDAELLAEETLRRLIDYKRRAIKGLKQKYDRGEPTAIIEQLHRGLFQYGIPTEGLEVSFRLRIEERIGVGLDELKRRWLESMRDQERSGRGFLVKSLRLTSRQKGHLKKTGDDPFKFTKSEVEESAAEGEHRRTAVAFLSSGFAFETIAWVEARPQYQTRITGTRGRYMRAWLEHLKRLIVPLKDQLPWTAKVDLAERPIGVTSGIALERVDVQSVINEQKEECSHDDKTAKRTWRRARTALSKIFQQATREAGQRLSDSERELTDTPLSAPEAQEVIEETLDLKRPLSPHCLMALMHPLRGAQRTLCELRHMSVSCPNGDEPCSAEQLEYAHAHMAHYLIDTVFRQRKSKRSTPSTPVAHLSGAEGDP